MAQVKWGIIGLGNIALKFSEGFQYTKNAKLFAISSRNKNKLQAFKNKFQIDDNYCFANYDSLLECKDLDIIYIALPHSLHYEWVMKSIEKEKNILVEKPATVNFLQMTNIKNNLKDKNIFFSEAFMYRYHPQISKVIELLKNNVIGNLVSMESLFGFDALGRKKIFGIKLNKLKKKPDRNNRLYNKELGGGAILDLGCYPVSFSILIASLISKFDFIKTKVLNKKKEIGPTGVDMNSFAELYFENNFKSTVGASLTQNLGKKTKIVGTKGELVLNDTWSPFNPSLIQINGENKETIEIECHDNIYTYEIEALSKCILENKKEPDFPGITLNETLKNMKILDEWLN
ncbi:MAG: Gfo/Idh/MocA family oxidoreductase [Pelagibacteraceae bacterium]|nr:Gfo/Idh/MocA family oxidoreductase [Pelagibacteraceae bacterium]